MLETREIEADEKRSAADRLMERLAKTKPRSAERRNEIYKPLIGYSPLRRSLDSVGLRT